MTLPGTDAIHRMSRRALLLTVLLVLGMAVGEGGLATLRARTGPTDGAQWIWIDHENKRHSGPVAFCVARDFELETVPEEARLLITADEEYRVTLNGQPVGSNRYRRGAPLDAYPVSRLLRPGPNRILVELRSSWGGGGLLATLDAPASEDGASADDVRTLLATDASWKLLRRHRLEVERGWAPLEDGGPLRVWGPPPIGRWGPVVAPREDRPLLADLYSPTGALLRPASRRTLPGSPNTFLLDWGQEVTGYLHLELAPRSGRLGLLFTATETPPEPLLPPLETNDDTPQTLEPEATVVALPGAAVWHDTQPRRFRYLLVQGLDGLEGAFLDPLPDTAFTQLHTPADPVRGVFGLQPPAGIQSPVKDLVRQEAATEEP